MSQSMQTQIAPQHHQPVSLVERHRFIEELRDAVLGVRGNLAGKPRDPKAKQFHKDVQSKKSKFPEVVGTLLVDAFNEKAPLHQVTRIAQVINSFFGPRSRRADRKYSDVSRLETVEQGEFSCAQNRVDLGDHSRPALLSLKAEIADYRAILDDMDASIDAELAGLLS